MNKNEFSIILNIFEIKRIDVRIYDLSNFAVKQNRTISYSVNCCSVNQSSIPNGYF